MFMMLCMHACRSIYMRSYSVYMYISVCSFVYVCQYHETWMERERERERDIFFRHKMRARLIRENMRADVASRHLQFQILLCRFATYAVVGGCNYVQLLHASNYYGSTTLQLRPFGSWE